MKEKIDFAKVPYQYAMCLNRQCPQANTCLRQLTEQSVPENIEHWVIISPKLFGQHKRRLPSLSFQYKSAICQRFYRNLRLYPS